MWHRIGDIGVIGGLVGRHRRVFVRNPEAPRRQSCAVEWTGPEAARRADLARGAGYALTVWPLFVASVGMPIGWLVWIALPGIILLAMGFLGEWLAVGEPQFMLTKRQSGAFVVATLLLWGTLGVVAGRGETAPTCVQDVVDLPNGSTNVTIQLAAEPSPLSILAPPSQSAGFAALEAPEGTAHILVQLIDDVEVRLEHRDPGSTTWSGGPGGGGEPEAGFTRYGRAEFARLDVRLSATAAGDRDGTSQVVAVRFLAEGLSECRTP